MRVTSLSVCTLLFVVAAGCGDRETANDGSGGDGGSTGGGGGNGSGADGGSAGSGAGASGGMGGSSGGEGGMGGSGGAAPQAVAIDFTAKVGDEAFDCATTYQNVGSADSEVSFRDFRVYIHNVRLLDSSTDSETPVLLTDDGLWQYQPAGSLPEEGVALLDFEDKTGSCQNGTVETNAQLIGEVEPGSYDGIAFSVGVPAALNHEDVAVATSPLNLSAMFWSWNGGYKHMRVDVMATGAEASFNMHLGSTMCTGDPLLGEAVTCTNPNRPEIRLTGFDPTSDTIVLDYAALVASSDVSADGCHSMPGDADCVEPFASLGIDHTTGQLTGAQTFFSVE